MLSIVTDKLRRQMLDDNAAVGSDALQREQPREMVVGMRTVNDDDDIQPLSDDAQNDFPASHDSRLLDFADHQSRESSINLAFTENPELVVRERDIESSSSCTSDDACRLCFPSHVLHLPTKKGHSHVMLSPDDNDASAIWRPDWQATSIWRPVGLRNPTPGFPAPTKLAPATLTSETSICEYGDWTSSRLSTSSESPSPVLRPASASSGFFENSGGPYDVTGQWAVGSKQSPSLNLSAFSLTSRLSLNDDDDDARGSVVRGVPGSGSMPAIGGNDGCSRSLGLLGQPQRSHSQPSVLLERRGVKKRRHREERRPNLNFFKMKETAYSKRHQGSAHSRARNHVQFIENNSNFLQVAKSDGGGDQSRFFYSLDTIASSPQQLAFCQASVSPTSGAATPLQSAGDSDVGEGGACSKSLDGSCNGDFVPCFALESPIDLESRTKKKKQLNVGIEEEEEEVFDLDLLDDLDIEEIEKD